MQIRAVFADEKVLWRGRLVHHREQRRLRIALQEPQVESRFFGEAGKLVAKAIEADAPRESTRDSQLGHYACHVPIGAAGPRQPVVAVHANEIGEGFTGTDEARPASPVHRVPSRHQYEHQNAHWSCSLPRM